MSGYEWRQMVKGDWSGEYKIDSYGLYAPNWDCVGTAMKHPQGQWGWQINRLDGIWHRQGSAATIEDVAKAVGELCPSAKDAKIIHARRSAKPISERPDATFNRYTR